MLSLQAQRTYFCMNFFVEDVHKPRKCLDVKQVLDVRHIALGYKRALTDTAAALCIFTHENMAMERATTANLTGTGNLKTFFRSAIGLYFWHD